MSNKEDGFHTEYHSNGQKESEGNYKKNEDTIQSYQNETCSRLIIYIFFVLVVFVSGTCI